MPQSFDFNATDKQKSYQQDVNNVNNVTKASNTNSLDCGKTIVIKTNQSFNESNLMTLPIFSLKREKVSRIERIWKRGDEEVGLIVEGSATRGCPTIYELDVLMALFKIMSKTMNNKIEVTEENKVTNMPKVINFTYRKLAKEMGFKKFGSSTKKRLENSIKCLTEATIYSNLSFRSQDEGKYITTFSGEESCRILKKYKSYSVTRQKRMKENLLSPKQIEEHQSVEIDSFFFDNLCNNYFKLYDYNKSMQLKKGISKKLLLILTQWSHGYEKYINMQTLYDYIGLDFDATGDLKKQKFYYNKKIKEALDELIEVKFIQSYKFEVNKGVLLDFNATGKKLARGLDKYTNDNDVVGRLREIGVEYEDINKYCRLDTMEYISALLRYVDDKESKGEIKNIKNFVYKGLPYEKYDVEKYKVK